MLTSTPLLAAKHGWRLLLHLCCPPRLADAYFYTSADYLDWQLLILYLCWLPRLAYTYFYTSADCQDWQMPCLFLHLHLHPRIANIYARKVVTGKRQVFTPASPPQHGQYPRIHLCFITAQCSRKCFLLHLYWPLFMSIAWECLFLQLLWLSTMADAYFYSSADCQSWYRLTSSSPLTTKYDHCFFLNLLC